MTNRVSYKYKEDDYVAFTCEGKPAYGKVKCGFPFDSILNEEMNQTHATPLKKGDAVYPVVTSCGVLLVAENAISHRTDRRGQEVLEKNPKFDPQQSVLVTLFVPAEEPRSPYAPSPGK